MRLLLLPLLPLSSGLLHQPLWESPSPPVLQTPLGTAVASAPGPRLREAGMGFPRRLSPWASPPATPTIPASAWRAAGARRIRAWQACPLRRDVRT